jgi:tetratricopeptide (TPR) repeat protein
MAKFHINLGSAYLELKRFDKASAEYHRAADLDPKDSEGHYHVGLVHQMNDKLDEAIAAYSRAIELEPDHGSAHRNRAVALLKNGQAPLAINDFEVVVKLRLNNPVAHYELAKCLCTANRWDEAIEALLTATRLQSDYAEAHQLLGMAQYRAGDYKSSIKNLNKAVELRNGGDGLDWFVLAMVHWQLDRKDDARKWYDKAVGWMEKNAPTNKELLVLRAEATKLLGLPLTDKNQPRADFEVTPNSTKDNSQPTTDNQPRTMND